MLNKFIKFIQNESTQVNLPVSEPTIENIDSDMTQDQKILNKFGNDCENFIKHENFPKKAKDYLDKIIKTVKQINVETISLEDQVKIRRNLELLIPDTINTYLALPKAHAVSVIVEKNKTSKELLIDKLSEYEKQLDLISIKAIEDQTAQMIKKQKSSNNQPAIKKDFFDI